MNIPEWMRYMLDRAFNTVVIAFLVLIAALILFAACDDRPSPWAQKRGLPYSIDCIYMGADMTIIFVLDRNDEPVGGFSVVSDEDGGGLCPALEGNLETMQSWRR